MTQYRDSFSDPDLSSVVGCGLDRLERDVSEEEIARAVNYYMHYKNAINTYPIGARRESVQEFIESGFTVPMWVIRVSNEMINK